VIQNTHFWPFRVYLVAMSPVSLALALTLVVPVAAAAQTAPGTQKQRRPGQAPFGQELEGQSRAALERQRAVPATAATPDTAAAIPPRPVVTDSEAVTFRIARRARGVGIDLNQPLPPGPPGPASPIR
jgi:hypothetical protein